MRDPTPEELAELEAPTPPRRRGRGAPAPKYREPTPEELAELNGEPAPDPLANAQRAFAGAGRLGTPEPTTWEKIKGAGRYLGQAVMEAPAAISENPAEAGRVAARSAGDVATLGLSEKHIKSREDYEAEIATAQQQGVPLHYLVRLREQAANAPSREQQARNAETLAAEDNRQKLARVGGALAAVPLSPGGGVAKTTATALPQAASAVGKVVRTAKIAGTAGFAEGTGRGLVAGKGIRGSLEEGVDTALTSAATAAGAEALTAGARQILKPAVARRERQVVQQLTENADPTHSRRLAGKYGEAAKPVVEFVDRNPAVTAARGNDVKMADVTDDIAERATRETKPIYQHMDQVAGPVGVKEVVDHLDAEIGRLAQDYGGSDVMERALEEVKGRVLRVAAKRGSDTMSHQDVRSWVTKLLKDELQTMGSIAETERFAIKDALHDVGDRFLKDRLATYAQLDPGLAQDVARLSALNTDIAMALKVNQAAKNGIARGYYAKKGGLGDAVSAAIAGGVLGTTANPAAAVGAYAVSRAVPRAARAVDRGVTGAAANVATGRTGPGPYIGPRGNLIMRQAEEERRRNEERAGIARRAQGR